MNLLIIGGLLALGILALVGAVFLGLSDQRSQAARNNSTEQSLPVGRSQPTVARTIEGPTMVRPNLSTADETTFAGRGSERQLPALNGQFHEVVGEIRTLHQQALQLEQRLSVLNEMVDRLERTQAGHTSIEEASHPAQDNN